jgi:4'-phosphopantetheinyl transferase
LGSLGHRALGAREPVAGTTSDDLRVSSHPAHDPDAALAIPGLSLWLASLVAPAELVDRARLLLSDDERRNADRGTPAVRARRTLARAALRLALGRCTGADPAALRLLSDAEGKPGIDGSGPAFSISHTDGWALIGVTSLGRIGVDLEGVVAIGELEAIARERFSAEAAADVLGVNGDARLWRFYRHWTRLEASLKARGIGLARGLAAGVGEPDLRGWTVAEVDPGPGLIGTVVVEGTHSWSGARLRPGVLDYPAALR